MKIKFIKACGMLDERRIPCTFYPSSNPIPSESDVEITKRLIEAGKVMDIKVLDHLIISADGTYFSLADECRI